LKLMLSKSSPVGHQCPICDSTGFVCVNHRDRPWAEISDRNDACRCGAGTPCGLCNSDDLPWWPAPTE
jgi:hypothetical protein